MMTSKTMLLGTLLAVCLTALAANGAEQNPHADHMLKCAQVCSDCQVTCDSCFNHCAALTGDGKKEHAQCMRLCVDCADCCKLCATLSARQSEFSGAMAECCAQCCDDCAAACEKVAGDTQMMACAKACRACATECRDMVNMVK